MDEQNISSLVAAAIKDAIANKSEEMTLEKAKAIGVKTMDNKGQTHKETYIERQYTDDEIQSIFGDIENFENLDI